MAELSHIEDWNKAIARYLKDRSVDDMTFIHEEVDQLPYAHQDNTSDRGRLTTGKNLIGTKHLQPTNRALLKALAQGSQSIDLSPTEEWSTLLNNVSLDYITAIVRGEAQDITKLSTYLDSHYDRGQINTLITSHALSSDRVQNNPLLFTSDRRGLDQIVDVLSQYKNCSVNNVAVDLTIGSNFYFEIAKLRAFRVLFANLQKALGNNPSPAFIITHPEQSIIEGEKGNVLIKETCIALSSVLGGANVTQLQPYKESSTSRSSINIMNVLQLESDIQRFEDPMHGSYFMEDLTDKIAIKIWDKLT